jgi:alpha-glucosidase (family GH31 glycosyl hydrolase)
MSLAACGGKDAEGPLSAELGGLTVRVTPRPARLEILAPDGTPLFDGLPGGSLSEGDAPHVAAAMRRAVGRYQFQVGAFLVDEPEAEPWTGVARFGRIRLEEEGGRAIRFELRGGGGQLLGQGAVEELGQGELAITFEAEDPGSGNSAGGGGPNRMSVAFGCAPGEHFLGLGGQSFDVDHRGHTVPIWVQEDGISKDDTGGDPPIWPLMGNRYTTHSPMPIFLSSRGYALMLDTSYRSIFALCSEAEEVGRVEAWEGRARFLFFYGPSPREAIGRLTGHLGRPELPPAFAFAPWLDAIFGEDNVRRVAERLRAEGVPVSAIWSEDWRGGEDDGTGYTLDEDWRLDRAVYPNFELLVEDLHSLGIKLLTYNNTFLEVGVDVWAEAEAGGYTIKRANGDPYLFTSAKFRDSSLADLTNPAAYEWVKDVYREGLEQGSDGWMADFAEWMPHDALLHSGVDAEGYHNLYPVDFQRLHRELFDEQLAEDGLERLYFVRSAYLGSQPLVSVFWAGDQQTDFSLGDGLPSVIPMGLGLGITGFPYFGHDIAGYMSQMTRPTTKELWFRWASFGALSPVMRTHHGKSARENWSWESDAETIAHLRRWASLHLRLFPYLYALAKEASETGMPMMRTLALQYPDWEPGWTLTDQYLLGDRILVAPVVAEGATSRVVELPEGVFFPLEGGAAVEIPAGGGSVTVQAPVTECPAFVPQGAVLVLLPEEVNTLVADTTNDSTGIVSHLDVGDDRELWLFPRGSSAWVEADGLSYDWQADELLGPVTSVTLDGSALELVGGAVTFLGNGTLTVNGEATLEVSGGSPDRRILVRFLWSP